MNIVYVGIQLFIIFLNSRLTRVSLPTRNSDSAPKIIIRLILSHIPRHDSN